MAAKTPTPTKKARPEAVRRPYAARPAKAPDRNTVARMQAFLSDLDDDGRAFLALLCVMGIGKDDPDPALERAKAVFMTAWNGLVHRGDPRMEAGVTKAFNASTGANDAAGAPTIRKLANAIDKCAQWDRWPADESARDAWLADAAGKFLARATEIDKTIARMPAPRVAEVLERFASGKVSTMAGAVADLIFKARALGTPTADTRDDVLSRVKSALKGHPWQVWSPQASSRPRND